MVEPDKDAPGRYLDELASAAVKYFGKKPIPPDLPGVSGSSASSPMRRGSLTFCCTSHTFSKDWRTS